MTIKLTVFGILLISTFSVFAQSDCHCVENFKWVKETFEKNDAGFAYILQEKGRDLYDKHTAAFLTKIKQARDPQVCADLMNEWLKFFRKAHFGVAPIAPATAKSAVRDGAGWPAYDMTERQIRDRYTAEKTAGFGGIWKTGAYTIGVFEQEGGYKGIIFQSSNAAWKLHQVKLNITKDGSGAFYMGDFSAQTFTRAELIGNNTLKLGTIYLTRVFPELADAPNIALYLKEISASTPFMQQLSDKTILFRIPSFDDSYKPAIDSLLAAYDAVLRRTENLVIDLRNNGGGDDISYEKLLPYLYTNPIRRIPLELYSTPLNNQRMAAYLTIPGITEVQKKEVNDDLKLLNDHLGQFVGFANGKDVMITQLDSVLPFPRQVAVMVNQWNGSTAEEFLLAARQSRKVKLYGVTTMGVLDISNMNFVESPGHEFRFGYCISKSLRIPDMAIDGKGIMPDYYLDKTIPDPEWLNFVQHNLEL